MQAIFALAVAAVLVLSMLPAIAQAPDDVLIKPVALCEAGKCVMSEKDYRQLQQFHAQRMVALMQAGKIIDDLQAQNELLMQKLTRFAMGCEKRSS